MSYQERFAAGTDALRRNDLGAAIENLRSCVDENEGDPRAHLYLGIAYGLSGQNVEAAQHLRRAVEIDPGNPQAQFNLARLYHRQGQLDEALASYRRTLVLDPSHEKARQEIDRLEAMAPGAATSEKPSEAPARPPWEQPAGPAEPVPPSAYAPAREGLEEDVAVRSVNIVSAIKVGGLLGMVLGWIYGVFYYFLLQDMFEGMPFGPGATMSSAQFRVVYFVSTAVAAPIFAVIGSAIGAALYNALAGWLGPVAYEQIRDGDLRVVRRLDALSVAKIYTGLTFAFMLLFLIVYIPIMMLALTAAAAGGGRGPGAGPMAAGAAVMIVVMAVVLLAVLGATFVVTLLLSFFYNWVAGFAGGVRFRSRPVGDHHEVRGFGLWPTVITVYVVYLPMTLLSALSGVASASMGDRGVAFYVNIAAPVLAFFGQLLIFGCYNLIAGGVGGLLVKLDVD